MRSASRLPTVLRRRPPQNTLTSTQQVTHRIPNALSQQPSDRAAQTPPFPPTKYITHISHAQHRQQTQPMHRAGSLPTILCRASGPHQHTSVLSNVQDIGFPLRSASSFPRMRGSFPPMAHTSPTYNTHYKTSNAATQQASQSNPHT
jgi:hypothetical protein